MDEEIIINERKAIKTGITVAMDVDGYDFKCFFNKNGSTVAKCWLVEYFETKYHFDVEVAEWEHNDHPFGHNEVLDEELENIIVQQWKDAQDLFKSGKYDKIVKRKSARGSARIAKKQMLKVFERMHCGDRDIITLGSKKALHANIEELLDKGFQLIKRNEFAAIMERKRRMNVIIGAYLFFAFVIPFLLYMIWLFNRPPDTILLYVE